MRRSIIYYFTKKSTIVWLYVKLRDFSPWLPPKAEITKKYSSLKLKPGVSSEGLKNAGPRRNIKTKKGGPFVLLILWPLAASLKELLRSYPEQNDRHCP